MNFLRHRTLSRRTFLRGAGAMLALPWLEIMAAPAKPAPLRSVFMFVPGGVNHDEWLPKSEGADYEAGRTLAALAPVRQHVLVLSGLNARRGEVGANGHPLGTAPWLSSAPLNDKDRGGYCTDVSVDQLIARQVGRETRLPSLELGCDADSRSLHETNISWRGPASPMGKEFNPRDIYNRLFADPRADVYRTSILDAVREDAKRLSGQLGGVDKEKLDEYFESVRSIERRIDFAARHQLDAPPEMKLPAGVPTDYLQHAHLLTDLLVLALRTDTTRVSTFMLNNEPGRPSWNEIGVKENHHGLAHLDPRTAEGRDKLEKLQRIDQAYVEIFVRMLQQLAALPEAGGTVLDHCQIVYGSGLTWGRLHNREDIPLLLAGGGSGMIRGGRHVRYRGEAFADLHLAMLRNSGVLLARTADSKAPLPGLA
jgi:hypothetical protein